MPDKDCVLGIVTTHNDHPIHAKHVLGRIHVVFTSFGYEVCGHEEQGGSPKGLVLNIPLQFFILGTSNIEFSCEAYFCNIVTPKNDHPIYVKHVLGRIYVSLTLFED